MGKKVTILDDDEIEVIMFALMEAEGRLEFNDAAELTGKVYLKPEDLEKVKAICERFRKVEFK